jgi:hypothetical protein
MQITCLFVHKHNTLTWKTEAGHFDLFADHGVGNSSLKFCNNDQFIIRTLFWEMTSVCV